MRKSKSNTKRFKLSVTNYAKFITKDKALPCKINNSLKGNAVVTGAAQDKRTKMMLFYLFSFLWYGDSKVKPARSYDDSEGSLPSNYLSSKCVVKSFNSGLTLPD